MEKFKILRHLEEKETKEMDRDSDIDPEEIQLLKNHYIPEILKDVENGYYNKIIIVSSDKKRSKKTSEILNNELEKEINIPIIQEEDPRISAEIHGKYKTGINPHDPLIKKAKFTYLKESIEKGNIWYRHGDVYNENKITYPEFEKIFEKPGENQIELNIRIYRFILDLINKIEKEPKNLYIISTHHIVMSTILSLIHIGEEKGNLVRLLYHPFGDMYKDENKATENMIGGWEKFYEFYKLRNYIFDIDLSKLKRMEDLIQNELDIDLAAYMQHYGKNI